jgi:hypothetical protein
MIVELYVLNSPDAIEEALVALNEEAAEPLPFIPVLE